MSCISKKKKKNVSVPWQKSSNNLVLIKIEKVSFLEDVSNFCSGDRFLFF